jgi:hypothetical protein
MIYLYNSPYRYIAFYFLCPVKHALAVKFLPIANVVGHIRLPITPLSAFVEGLYLQQVFSHLCPDMVDTNDSRFVKYDILTKPLGTLFFLKEFLRCLYASSIFLGLSSSDMRSIISARDWSLHFVSIENLIEIHSLVVTSWWSCLRVFCLLLRASLNFPSTRLGCNHQATGMHSDSVSRPILPWRSMAFR